MTTFDALFYPAGSARAEPVRVSVSQTFVTVMAPAWSRRDPLAGIQATSRLARTRRVLTLADGSQLHTDDNDAVDALFPRQGAERLIDSLERHPYAIATSLLFTFAATILFFTLGLPWLANRIAQEIPIAAERVLGEQVLMALDETAFEPSAIPEPAQARIRQRAAELTDGGDGERQYDVQFRALGSANAFAIPGGTILITDELVAELDDDDALMAVIAHEMGHHEARHVLRSVLQSSAILVLTTFVTADVNAAAAVMLAVPAFLLNGHYSRAFELEADAFAFAHLVRHGVSPEWFAYALTQIERESADGEMFDYAATHPRAGERIAAAQSEAQEFPPLEAIVAARDTGSGKVQLTDVMLWGCWQGSHAEGPDSSNDWWIRFHQDGQLEVEFMAHVGDHARATYYTGRWQVQGSTLATRYLRRQDETSDADIDRLLRYTVDRFDDAQMRYFGVPGDTTYYSYRIDCSQATTAPSTSP